MQYTILSLEYKFIFIYPIQYMQVQISLIVRSFSAFISEIMISFVFLRIFLRIFFLFENTREKQNDNCLNDDKKIREIFFTEKVGDMDREAKTLFGEIGIEHDISNTMLILFGGG